MVLVSVNHVNGQTTSSDSNSDTLCFTLDQANYLLKSTEKYIFADSIIQVQNEKIINLQKVYNVQGQQLQVAQKIIEAERNEVERLQKQKKALKLGLGASIVGLIVFVIL